MASLIMSIPALLALRLAVATLLALGLSLHGYVKKSLDLSGCMAACLVGFIGVASSYRHGLLLISFYFSSSKLTKLKEDVKASLEEDYAPGGQRNWIQVFANSVLSTALAAFYYYYIGEDQEIFFGSSSSSSSLTNVVDLFGFRFEKSFLASQLACMYVAHFATANGDTWASEVGILSPSQPRLSTSFFTRVVPPGTNGGMSLRGTTASILGGGFIGFLHWALSWSISNQTKSLQSQFPVVIFGCCCGFIGSLIDSLLGATLQASYYNTETKKIVKHFTSKKSDAKILHICGVDILSNESVNLVSIAITMLLSLVVSPSFFCLFSQDQCRAN